jgi:hypothetical protein
MHQMHNAADGREGPNRATPRAMYETWLTVEYASRRFKSS